MADRYTFPQSGDEDDAENFAALVGMSNVTDYVETGLNLQAYDAGAPSIDVTTGKVFISEASDTGASSGNTLLFTNSFVQLPAVTDLALTDNDVNNIYVDPDFGTLNSGEVIATTAAVPSGALKIGEVDTTNDTVTEVNRAPDISVGNITDEDGNTLYDGENNEVPAERIDQGPGSGLDADTLDGSEASAFSDSVDETVASNIQSTVSTGLGSGLHTVFSDSTPRRIVSFAHTSGNTDFPTALKYVEVTFDDDSTFRFGDTGGGSGNIKPVLSLPELSNVKQVDVSLEGINGTDKTVVYYI